MNALGVETHFDTRAQALIVDSEKAVRGLVLNVGGEEKYARAFGGVILCAGGFVLNQEMLQQYAPHFTRFADDALSGGYDDGSGIRMGMSVGGAAIHMDELFMTLPIYPPEENVRGILVNEQGSRFINEDAYPGRIAVYCTRQVGDRIYLLVDESIFSQPTELQRWEIAAVGESWQEVEHELGMVEGSLTATVEVHNRHAAKGEDPLFHKHEKWLKPLDEPPFAALGLSYRRGLLPLLHVGGAPRSNHGRGPDDGRRGRQRSLRRRAHGLWAPALGGRI